MKEKISETKQLKSTSALKGGTTKPVWKLAVVSSNIRSAEYNVKKERLTIKFKSGATYDYFAVTVKEFTAFTLAPSQGVFLSTKIKPKKKYKKISAE